MKKFHNKYRIPSARLPGWDYRHAGAYFITICTQNRLPFFGECEQGKMKLSTAGMIVQGCWHQIPYLNRHVALGAFVVMPNHVHGILMLDEMENDGNATFGVETFESNVSTPNAHTPNVVSPNVHSLTDNISNHNVPNGNTLNQPPNVNPVFEPKDKTNMVGVSINNDNKNSFYQNISPKSGSVSRIIQQYKTVCTKHIRGACSELDFEWQTRFYDHIIRNRQAFQNISNYIINNPKNWNEDKFHTSSL